MNKLACAALVALIALWPAFAAAQAPARPAEPAVQAPAETAEPAAPVDFRGKVTFAYGLVFALVVVFLVLSHRRNAGLQEEIEFLERRLDELERGGAPR